jgi:hypothetical protein
VLIPTVADVVQVVVAEISVLYSTSVLVAKHSSRLIAIEAVVVVVRIALLTTSVFVEIGPTEVCLNISSNIQLSIRSSYLYRSCDCDRASNKADITRACRSKSDWRYGACA